MTVEDFVRELERAETALAACTRHFAAVGADRPGSGQAPLDQLALSVGLTLETLRAFLIRVKDMPDSTGRYIRYSDAEAASAEAEQDGYIAGYRAGRGFDMGDPTSDYDFLQGQHAMLAKCIAEVEGLVGSDLHRTNVNLGEALTALRALEGQS